MVVEKLPEVVPPSGRVPGRGLLVLPILEERRRRNRGEIAKKGSRFGVFASRGINRQRGQTWGPPGVQAPPWRGPTLGRAGRAPGALVGPLCPLPPSVVPEASCTLIFIRFFPNFWSTFNMGET